MKITSIRIKKNNMNNDNLLGVASVQLDNCLTIHGLQLIQLKNKRIISFPHKKVKKFMYTESEGYTETFEYTDIVHPSNKEFREYIEEQIFKIYDSEMEEKFNE